MQSIKTLLTVLVTFFSHNVFAQTKEVETPPVNATKSIEHAASYLHTHFSKFIDIETFLSELKIILQNEAIQKQILNFLFPFFATLFLSIFLFWLIKKVLRKYVFVRREIKNTTHLYLHAIARIVLYLIPFVCFFFIFNALLTFSIYDSLERTIASLAINTFLIAIILPGIIRVLFFAKDQNIRLSNLSAESSQKLLKIFRTSAILIATSYLFYSVSIHFKIVAHVNIISTGLNFILTSYLIIISFRNHFVVGNFLQEKDATLSTKAKALSLLYRPFIHVWHIVFSAILIMLFYTLTFKGMASFEPLGFSIFLTIFCLWCLQTLLSEIDQRITSFFLLNLGSFFQKEEHAKKSASFFKHALKGFLYICAALLILESWSINTSFFIFHPTTITFCKKLFSILIILSLAGLILKIGNALFEKLIRNKTGKKSAARIKTLVSLIRNALRVGVWTPVFIIILAELGFNTTPILASVSILSVAVGLGAQNLVKDVITGLFIILEDTIAVGDYIIIAGLTGEVESITIRTVRLRDDFGYVHTVPFNNITNITNKTREFCVAIIHTLVDHQSDLDMIYKLLQENTRNMKNSDAFKDLILSDVDIKGVEDIKDAGIIVESRIKTQPGKNMTLRRLFSQELHKLFQKNNISYPVSEQVVHLKKESSV